MSLVGATVLITRARSQASALAALVGQRGGRVWEFPVISIAPPESWEPLDQAIRRLANYHWLVITSPNGAEQFAARLRAGGTGPGALSHLRVAAVGAATAKSLEALGIRVDLVPEQFRGAALPAAMAPLLEPGDRVLMARGDLADPALASALRGLGAEVDDVVAYRTLQSGGDAETLRFALEDGQIDYVTLTSSSTVTGLVERLGGPESLTGGRVRIACIGPETKKAAEAAGLTVHLVPPQATLEALVISMESDYSKEEPR